MKILFNIDSSAEPYREDCDSHCKHEMKNIQFTHILYEGVPKACIFSVNQN